MHDPNLRDFHSRIGRIERTHANGGGFEAAGTLGMSYYNALKAPRRRYGWLMPMVLVAMTIVAIKAGILATIGDDAYTARLATLSQGDVADQIGAYVLQADPLTHYIASVVRGY